MTILERPKYSRVVLKLSGGEALAGERGGFGVDIDTVRWIAGQVSEAYALGTQLAIVVGGGNIWRGDLRQVGWAWIEAVQTMRACSLQ